MLVEFEINDIVSLVLADGRTIDKWIEDANASGGEALEYFNKLVKENTLNNGYLFCASKLTNNDPLQLSILVLYDGWHRTAAWVARNRQGDSTTIKSYLVIANEEDRFFQL